MEGIFARGKLDNSYVRKRLLQIRIVNQSLSSFYPALRFFQPGQRVMNLTFKDGTKINCRSRTEAFNLCMYYYIANRMGTYSREEMRNIQNLSKLLNTAMKDAFTEDEISTCATGANAYFSPTLMALYVLVRQAKPEIVVQTGVASGVSSSLILLALKMNGNGELVDIDLPNRKKGGYAYSDGTIDLVYTPKENEPGWLIPDYLRSKWRLRLGPSREILPRIEKVDFFYHDSEHSYENMTFEYEWAYLRLPTQGILASDDVGWNNAWRDFHHKHSYMFPLLGHIDFEVSQNNTV